MFNRNQPMGLGGSSTSASWGGMSQAAFASRVIPVFGLALLAAAGGVYLGQQLGFGMQMLAVGGELALVFTSGLWARKEGLNKLLFFIYAALSGLTLVPILTYAAHGYGIGLIGQALTMTAVTFAGLVAYGATTKRDFTNLGGFLFMGILAVIVIGLLNAFLFHSGITGMAISFASVALFSGFVLYDMNNIRRSYTDADYVMAALQLFINFMGLFVNILRLLMVFGGGNNNNDRDF
jgi:FtsH-binding integral membrane protein